MSGEQTFIYFAQMRGSAVIKIGRARNPVARVASFSTGNPFPLQLLGAIPETAFCTETHIHRRFDQCRLSGEWFVLLPDIQEYLTSQGIPFEWGEEIEDRLLVDWVRCLPIERVRRYLANAKAILAELQADHPLPN
jgi:hypothetical protein